MNERQRRLILTLGLATLSACTTMNDHPATPANQAKQTAEAAAPKAAPKGPPPRHTAKQIQALSKRLRDHPASLYSVKRDEYSLYLGGRLTATVSGSDGGLSLVPDNGSEGACHFDAKGQPAPSAQGTKGSMGDNERCERLLSELEDLLGTE